MSIQEHKDYPALLLEYYIDQLAEHIVLDADGMCSLCVRGSCYYQVSGLTCRNGVKAWLLERRPEYEEFLTEELQKEFHYLDELRSSNVTNMYGAVPYLQEQFPYWSEAWYAHVLKIWMDTYTERMSEK